MQRFAKILGGLGLSMARPSDAILTWCLDLGMAPHVLEALSCGWVARDSESIGKAMLRLLAADRIQERHRDYPQYHRDGILAVGSCMNGDEIGIDLLSGELLYLSHEHLWAPGDHDTRKHSKVVADSLDDFAAQLREDTLPHDYWSKGRAPAS